MILIQKPQLSNITSCTYIPERECVFEYFFALDLNGEELNKLLEKGWRKFGVYYFRPGCMDCYRCIPIRVLTREFKPTKSQRRVIRKGSEIKVKFGPLRYSDEIYEIYRDHSENRFGMETDKEDFMASFYTQSCPALQSEYYLGNEFIAVGFLDRTSESLSSVYFIFKTAYEKYRLGTLSVIKETEHAALLGLKYYYLGYYIEENLSMSYKNRFRPNEKYDWHKKRWFREELQ